MENIEKKIHYNFIRNEKDNSFVVFILFLDKWKDKDINFEIQNDKFTMDIEGENKIESDIILSNLLEHMQYNNTPVIFHDKNGNFLAETLIKPIIKKYKKIS